MPLRSRPTGFPALVPSPGAGPARRTGRPHPRVGAWARGPHAAAPHARAVRARHICGTDRDDCGGGSAQAGQEEKGQKVAGERGLRDYITERGHRDMT